MSRLIDSLLTYKFVSTLMASLFVIGFSLYNLFHGHPNQYTKILYYPFLGLGILMFLFSLLALIVSCCRFSFFLCLCQFLTFLLLIGLVVFSIFTLAITIKGKGHAISGRGFKEYRLEDYPNWLKNLVVDEKSWKGLRSFLADEQVCEGLRSSNMTADQFYNEKLSPIESGCCKPPTSCGFTYQNATFWVVPKSGATLKDSDCETWSNQQKTLCYDCNSCKAGILDFTYKYWMFFASLYFCVSGVLTFASSFDRSASRSRAKPVALSKI